MKKRFFALMVALAMVLSFSFAFAEEAEVETEADPVLATVNGQSLKLSDVTFYASQLAASGEIASEDDLKSAFDYALVYYLIPRAKVEEIGVRELLGDEYDAQLAAAEEEYETAIQSYIDYFAEEGADDEAIEALRAEAEQYYKDAGFDKEAYMDEVVINAAFNAMVEAIEVTVSDAQIEAEYNLAAANYESYFKDDVSMYEYYTKYLGYDVLYRPDGYRGVLQILLMADEALGTAYSEAEEGEAKQAAADAILESLRDKIDEIYARLDAGEDFAAILTEYNEDPGMMTEDALQNGYDVHKDSIIYMSEFTEAAFSDKMQKIGDVSDPAVTSYGVHILMYLRDIPGGVEPMTESARASVENYLIGRARDAKIAEWAAEYEVEYTDDYRALIGE